MRFKRFGWFVLRLGPHRPSRSGTGIGSACGRWHAQHLCWRLYLVGVKPRDEHRMPGWVRFLREFTTRRRWMRRSMRLRPRTNQWS